jgi:hypothetical protein
MSLSYGTISQGEFTFYSMLRILHHFYTCDFIIAYSRRSAIGRAKTLRRSHSLGNDMSLSQGPHGPLQLIWYAKRTVLNTELWAESN